MDQAETLPMGDVFSDPIEGEGTDADFVEGGEEEAEKEEDEEVDLVESHEVCEDDQMNESQDACEDDQMDDLHNAPSTHGQTTAVPEKQVTTKAEKPPAQPDEHPEIESDGEGKVEERTKGTNMDCKNHV